MHVLFWGTCAAIVMMWGMLPIVQKMLMHDHGFTPKSLLVLTSTIYFLAIVAVAFIHREEVVSTVKRMTLKAWGLLVLSALVFAFIGNTIYYHAVKAYPSYLVVTVTSIFPIVTLVAATVLLKEKPQPLAWFGVMIVAIGIMMIGYAERTTSMLVNVDSAK